MHNIIFFALYSAFGTDQLGAFTFELISNLQFWFTLLITISIALVPIIISRKVDNLFLYNIINNLRNGNYEEDCLKKIYTKKIEHMSRCTRSIFKFKRFLHENGEYEPDNFKEYDQFNIRYIRAKSVDVKSNFFKTLQSINFKIRNNKRKLSLKDKDKEKDINMSDNFIKKEFASNPQITDNNKEDAGPK
jgi:hypothetical protein